MTKHLLAHALLAALVQSVLGADAAPNRAFATVRDLSLIHI